MSCPNCGKRIESSDQKFCRYCSAELKSNIESSKSQINHVNKEITRGYSKTVFSLAILSVVLAIVTLIIGLIIYFFITSSIYYEYGQGDIFYLLLMIREGEYYFPFFPIPYPNLEEDLKLGALVFGIMLIIIGSIGIVLGIVSLIIRKNARDIKTAKKSLKISLILAILGISLNTIGLLIAGIITNIPHYLREQYHYETYYALKILSKIDFFMRVI
jgi:hypothetical protein